MWCKDCGAQWSNNADRDRCICGGTFRSTKGETRPHRLLREMGRQRWVSRVTGAQSIERGDGTLTVTFEFEEPEDG